MSTGPPCERIVPASTSQDAKTGSATDVGGGVLSVDLSGVNRGSRMPAIVRPFTVLIELSSTIAFFCLATARAVVVESWLPRMYTYGTPSLPIGSTNDDSNGVPQSLMSPVSMTRSMWNCTTAVEITDQAAGLRCKSEMCSTRMVSGLGSNTGSVLTVE